MKWIVVLLLLAAGCISNERLDSKIAAYPQYKEPASMSEKQILWQQCHKLGKPYPCEVE